ncbi:hypothetical protein Hden_3250 [Hyphomicrobium denitrificans ATCC 51888]|uniref:Uncharacterized protein n=1 Tax=Hyphomicrobium denitrificans (strain ATCC 51888 / DSM 1869 / NCIMB 11706 / TK 0415) TaxID=582899 RepID=D8JWT5_HYPDA|nr:hypothetical protein Hden_3250 [Hyphomicrobium denitrificans ATCC 51888]
MRKSFVFLLYVVHLAMLIKSEMPWQEKLLFLFSLHLAMFQIFKSR